MCPKLVKLERLNWPLIAPFKTKFSIHFSENILDTCKLCIPLLYRSLSLNQFASNFLFKPVLKSAHVKNIIDEKNDRILKLIARCAGFQLLKSKGSINEKSLKC